MNKRPRKNKFVKVLSWIITLIIIGAIIYVLGLIGFSIARHLSKPKTPAVTTVTTTDNGVQAVMNSAEFQKEEQNKAQQIYLQQQMTELKADYDAKNADLETKLENARQEELTFQSPPMQKE